MSFVMPKKKNIHVVCQIGSDLKPEMLHQSYCNLSDADNMFRWLVRNALTGDFKAPSKILLMAGHSVLKSYENHSKTFNHLIINNLNL